MRPFTDRPSESAASLGEAALIEQVRQWLGDSSPPPPSGIGDDCAVWKPSPGEQALVTTDPIIYGRHFDDGVSPVEAAAKLIRRNLSDIAAMGGRPRAAVASLLLPPECSLSWLETFHRSLAAEARRWKIILAGGDICQTDGLLGICLTMLGETVQGAVLTRHGGAPGDWIAVTGDAGGSRLGKHCRFEPRLAEGQWLARQPEAVALMDLSDGLAKDLPALVPPNARARIDLESIPVAEAARLLSVSSGRTPIDHAVNDGEDYELLLVFRATPSPHPFLQRWRGVFPLPLTVIGRILEGRGRETVEWWQGTEQLKTSWKGYEHFR